MIMVHHGFADGNHIVIFIKKLNEKIANFNKYIERMV
jgi:chloramphenicol O-acetyltransferase